MEIIEIQLWLNKDTLSEDYAIIDAEDYDKVVKKTTFKNGNTRVKKWYVKMSSTGAKYAQSGCRRQSIHREVMDNPYGMCVDHINGNPLDNRKKNLRVCTHSQNQMNRKLRRDSRSGFKGVWLSPDGSIIKAYIGVPNTSGKKTIKLGSFKTIEEAARAYDAKAKELFGEYAKLNFPN